MAEIIIKKRVNLGFLGADYEESYLDFKSISIQEYPSLMKRVEKATEDSSKSLGVMIEILKEHYVDGIFNKQKVDKEDLGKFDAETTVKCFENLTGQADPKENSESKTTSSTDTDIAQK